MTLTASLFRFTRHFQNSSRSRNPNRNRLRKLLIQQMEERRVLATIDLAALTTEQGATIFGAIENEFSGRTVSDAGDVNGDGFLDFLIGTAGFGSLAAGECYLLLGGSDLSATLDLANLGTAGAKIRGVETNDFSGIAVSRAGDVNGDGFDDLIIGAYLADALENKKPDAGESYVFFGSSTIPPVINLATPGVIGVTIYGVESTDYSGRPVSSAGDVNGDGFDDLLIGASGADGLGNGKPSSGESYLIFGGAELPTTIDLANLGSAGVTVVGADADDYSGWSISSAGDMNGDGFDDFAIGAFQADALGNAKSFAGETYVVFGGASLPSVIDLASLGARGITIYGADERDFSGQSVSNAGDVNGDGFDDLIIGAWGGDGFQNTKPGAGESYLIFGAAAIPTAIDLGILGSGGTTIFGVESDEQSGASVSAAGDLNGDGYDDLLIGSIAAGGAGNTKSNAGESYVVFGRKSMPTNIELANVNGGGVTIFGADAEDRSGYSLSTAGDVNGDGFDDILVSAYKADGLGNAKNQSGDTYLIFGGNFTGAITHQGTAAGETITGTAIANTINGHRGNDLLVGNGGPDVLIGGQGDDTISISDLNLSRVIGGTGSDTLRLDGAAMTLDLTVLPDNRLHGIERIDLTGSGDNVLTLNQREVLNISDESNTLAVFRNNGNTVNIGSGWTQGADESIGGNVFNVFVQGAAKLKIQASHNFPPSDISLSSVTIAENLAIAKTIGDFNTTDPDSGDSFTYSLVSGSGASDNSAFTISDNQLKTNAVFNFETKDTYSIRVRTTDARGLTFEKIFVINVSDINESPGLQLSNLLSSVQESNNGSAVVADIGVIDDALGSDDLSLSGPDAVMFEISDGKLKLRPGELDFETQSTLRVTVSVDDPTVGSTPDQSIEVVLNIADVNEVPGLSLSNIVTFVPESNTVGMNVADFEINDDALGTNNISVTGPDVAMFEVFGGKLKLKPSTLDFETKPILRVTLSVDDPAVGTSPDQSIDVVLNVTDVNEAPSEVVFTNISLRMAEEITLTQSGSVADVSVTDDALGSNELSLQGPDAQHFEIVNNKLRVKSGTRFDFESQSVYRVQVIAKDLSLTSSTSVSREYVLNIDNIPEVAGVTILDGQGWNDSVRQVRIQFDTIVNLTNSALEWSKKDVGGALVPFVAQTSVVNNRTVADIRFQGRYVDAVGLLDGSYDLMVRGDQVSGASTGFLGLSYTESFLAIRPRPAFAMNISLASTIAVGAVTPLSVELVGASGTGIRYDIDLDGDGDSERTVLGGASIVLNDVVFAHGGSRTVQITAVRNGVTLAQGSAVVDVVPYTVRGSSWISTLDVDADETVSPLDVLGVINWLNDSSSDRRYALNLDVDRDASISPLDVLAIINHINEAGSGASPSPFVSLVMNDSGSADGLTSNVGIQGRAKETNAKLFLSLDGAPRRESVRAIGADGSFDLTDEAISQLFGSSLEGDHLVTIGTVGSDGAWRGMDRRFTRTIRSLNTFELTTALQNGGLSLAWASAGNGSRYRVMQSIDSQSPVVLADGLSALSTRIDLPMGVFDLFVEAFDALGNRQRSPTVRVRIV